MVENYMVCNCKKVSYADIEDAEKTGDKANWSETNREYYFTGTIKAAS